MQSYTVLGVCILILTFCGTLDAPAASLGMPRSLIAAGALGALLLAPCAFGPPSLRFNAAALFWPLLWGLYAIQQQERRMTLYALCLLLPFCVPAARMGIALIVDTRLFWVLGTDELAAGMLLWLLCMAFEYARGRYPLQKTQRRSYR